MESVSPTERPGGVCPLGGPLRMVRCAGRKEEIEGSQSLLGDRTWRVMRAGRNEGRSEGRRMESSGVPPPPPMPTHFVGQSMNRLRAGGVHIGTNPKSVRRQGRQHDKPE